MLFDELDQLKTLARAIELEAASTPEEEEDLPAVVIDGEMDNRPYDPNPKVSTYIVGSSANVTTGDVKKPIFDDKEVSEDGEADESLVDSVLSKGLGVTNVGASLHKGLNECMDMCDPDCPVAFRVGCFVKPKACQTPVILIVKNADGSNILTAKPTNDSDECCDGNCGCWPEFSFAQDEIEPMDDVKLSDIFNVMKFNDMQGCTESFNGGVYDETPMDDAQEGVRKAQSAYNCPGCDECKDGEFKPNWEQFNDFMDYMNDIHPIEDVSVKTPVIVKKNADGSTSASQAAYRATIGTGAF